MTTDSLAVVQGPTQALAVISLLQGTSEPNSTNHRQQANSVHFLIGDLCAGDQNAQLLETTRQILAACGFNTVIETTADDLLFYSGRISFANYCERLHRKLKSNRYKKVYVCRRMALLNEAVLEVCEHSKKLCYGDSFGGLDNGIPSWCAPINSKGFRKIDECHAVAPFEENFNGSLGCEIIAQGKDALKSTLSRAMSHFDQNFHRLKQYLPKDSGVCLLTTANLTESQATRDLDCEIQYYLECLGSGEPLNPHLVYLVKGHPRQTKQQSKILAEELRQQGLNADSDCWDTSLPTEMLLSSLRPVSIIPFLSSTGYCGRLLDPLIEVRYDKSPGSVLKKYIVPKTSNWHLLPEKLQALTMLSSYPWTRCVKYTRFILNALLFRGISLRFPGREPERALQKLLKFEELQKSIINLSLIAMRSRERRLQYITDLAG
jgi:hypothetical protein